MFLQKLLQSNEGRFSLEFLFENQNTHQEQKIVINLLSPHIRYLFSNRKYLRIIECIIGCFNQELLVPIIIEGMKNLVDHIRCREGFFLAKALICAIKSENLQLIIVQGVLNNLPSYFTFNNGCLLIKLIIKQFNETTYTYVKNASKHVEENPKNLSITHIYSSKIITSKALGILIQGICSYSKFWDIKPWKAVIFYCLKNSIYFNQIVYSNIVGDPAFLLQFLKLEIATKCLMHLTEKLSNWQTLSICIYLRENQHKLSIVNPELCKSIVSFINKSNSEGIYQMKLNHFSESLIVNECHNLKYKFSAKQITNGARPKQSTEQQSIFASSQFLATNYYYQYCV